MNLQRTSGSIHGHPPVLHTCFVRYRDQSTVFGGAYAPRGVRLRLRAPGGARPTRAARRARRDGAPRARVQRVPLPESGVASLFSRDIAGHAGVHQGRTPAQPPLRTTPVYHSHIIRCILPWSVHVEISVGGGHANWVLRALDEVSVRLPEAADLRGERAGRLSSPCQIRLSSLRRGLS